MEPNEAAAIDSVLRAQLGDSARWRQYDRAPNTPMNFLLSRAERHLSERFVVYWVDDAPPEVFCLRGFSLPIAVFSTRYVELWADLRGILRNQFGSQFTTLLAERIALRLIAELSLSYDDPEFAASTMLRSTMAGQGISSAPNTILSLELEPIGAPYMACWFYGIAHELGHVAVAKTAQSIQDDAILAAVDSALDRWDLPADLREEARSAARANPKDHILGVDHLRAEAHSDAFATSLLFESTEEIMRDPTQKARPYDGQRFRLDAFIWEMTVSLNIIALFERCRWTAGHACTAAPRREYALENALQPVAVAVRLSIVRWYLVHASARYLLDHDPTADDLLKISQAIDEIMESLRPAIESAEKGLAQAMEISLNRERRGSFLDVLHKWQMTVGKQKAGFSIQHSEITRFCALAASRGRKSWVFEAMLTAAEKPSEVVQPRLEGAVHLCPWVDGPEAFSTPFGLETRHGLIVFVFLRDDGLLHSFVDVFAKQLAEGYTMKTALVLANTKRELDEAVARRMRVNLRPIVVVEGTREFDDFMNELREGTIGPTPEAGG